MSFPRDPVRQCRWTARRANPFYAWSTPGGDRAAAVSGRAVLTPGEATATFAGTGLVKRNAGAERHVADM